VGSWWFVNAYSSHSFHNTKKVGPKNTKGLFPGVQGGQFPGCKVMVLQANQVGSWRWPCGFAYHYYLGFDICSLGLVPNYVVLVQGNEGGGPHHMQGCHIYTYGTYGLV
jgi:hypothetical protein